jgi:thiamine biosynthesis lipoprotein
MESAYAKRSMNAMRPLLGTYVRIIVHSEPTESAATSAMHAQAIEAAFAAIALVQKQMSAFSPDSDLGRIRRLAHLEPVTVHPWTQDVIDLAQSLHTQSEGLFDPGIAPQLASWGVLPANLEKFGNTARSSIMQLTVQDGRVRSATPCHIDLGGIAKGFAVDRAIDALNVCGISSASVNAGGDLRVIGPAPEPIYVRQPYGSEPVFAGLLQDGACATSAIYYSLRAHGGHTISALVNPHNHQPLLCPDSFSVIAPVCAVADALTKVLALSRNIALPCFAHYGAQPFITAST